MGAVINYQGVSHLALVCDDMARTVEFYENVMDMPLVKSMEMPNNLGHHFFFDIGNGDCLAFFCYSDDLVRPAAPGIAAPATNTDISANGSMHHIAFEIAPEEVEKCCERFTKLGVDYQFKAHNKGPDGKNLSDLDDEDSFCASIYLWDPDGVRIELCAWMPAWHEVGNDVVPMTRKVPVEQGAGR